ncbi:MAG: LPS export ABC transporter periplasmic protein LptC [Bacteroidetes bacterium]|nr:LPS export ABC transporter periplasmic protein LptC [Bacteroidota bacterium]MBS1756242.1 LPS export ABC transporter periplasmic protein LptC [Bacteroidota bacterium]
MIKKDFYKYLTAAFLLGCFFLSSCENDEKEVKKLSSKVLGIEEAKYVKINYSVGGKVKAILTSSLMLRVQDTVPYVEFPKDIHVDFYNDSQKVESILTARYGRYKESQGIVLLRDSVKVINIDKGDTLYCMELNWDRSRPGREFYTDKPVRIRTKTETLNGIGMEAKQNFKDFVILKPVGPIKVPASQFPQ